MRFTRKAREQKQKNWRMWKKGKQWLCGAALFFTVVSSPGMLVLADEVNSGNSTEVTAGEVEAPLPKESTETEVAEVTEKDEASSSETVTPNQQEKTTPNTAKNNETKTVEGKKESLKQGSIITSPQAISDIFPDAKLAEAMRVELNKASVSDMVTQSDLDAVVNIQIVGKKVTNISGMAYLRNLTSLNLIANEVKDVSELSSLPNLTFLSLNQNKGFDLSTLSGLTNLTTLWICNASLSSQSNLSALSGLTNLTTLWLGNNQISDVSELSSALSVLPNLRTLDLGGNQISDVRDLTGLTNLTDLRLNYNQISDIDALSSMTNIVNFSLASNQIKDLSGLSGLTDLKYLSIGDNQISDVSNLSSLVNLNTLVCSNNQISDLSALSNLNDLIVLDLNNNQISDISSLSGLTNLTELWLDKNHISDLSVLANEVKNNASVRISAIGQSVILPKINWSPSLEMPVKVKDTNSEIIPTSISNSGQFVDNGITWTELSNTNQNVAYSWSVDGNVKFSGTATTEVTPIALRILLDDDGNSQTPEDQTLFAEEASNINYLEDIYNYAKEKLSGTDYGLVDIQEDSNGFYKIIVSKVGSLKTEDVNGDSIETDKAYTPNYTVTGTKNKAQLNASYGVTVDSSPGYVYIYEKNTPQEVRYGAGANINMPLTDTNGNGKPQWQENYTIVQYKKAGDLTPTLQDGSQVPGGNISIPNDAVAGDLVAVPDKITGSDGKEYGVDPKVVDVDPNAPGVQIKLTEYEQDIPYLDIVLSESESTSLSESESTSLSESESTSL
ncbi:leucine-rich repeat domain-containing protein, partial [Listeria monocytogenes]